MTENTPPILTEEERNRYTRQILIPEIGMQGQGMLKQAKVLVVGAGGLGSPVLLYLAAAGVGTLGIADNDVVDISNLQRQVLYSTSDVGQYKADLAKKKIDQLNPNITSIIYRTRLDETNADSIFKSYSLIVDCTDNFLTKFLINDTCVAQHKPWVYASIFSFSGELAVFDENGPCYRCLYPEAPPANLYPTQAQGRVLGVLPGIIGCMQACEAIKIIVKLGTCMKSLFTFDARTLITQKFAIDTNEDCKHYLHHQKATLNKKRFIGVK